MGTFLKVNLLFDVFADCSGALALLAVEFVAESWAGSALHFLLVFTVENFAFAATRDAGLWLLIWAGGAIDFTGELNFLLTAFKWLIQTDAHVDVDVFTSFRFFEFFIAAVVLIKGLKVFPVLFEGGFGAFLWVGLVRVVFFGVAIKRRVCLWLVIVTGVGLALDDEVVGLAMIWWGLLWWFRRISGGRWATCSHRGGTVWPVRSNAFWLRLKLCLSELLRFCNWLILLRMGFLV
jgi:hypothetical protein